MIKNYIFDFGQVIVKFDTHFMTSVYIKETKDIEKVEQVVFDRLYWDKLDAGTITDDEVKAGICSRLPEELHKSACLVYDNWYYNLPFINGIVELLSGIKANGGKLYLLSNISEGFAENYKNVMALKSLFEIFDGLVFSAPIGLTKPDKEIFDYVLAKYNLNPQETVFIDDNINNILGARASGIKGYLFDGNISKLKGELG